MRSFQVLRNDDPANNPKDAEGEFPFTFIGVADCAFPGGPVDGRSIKGLGKNYGSAREFLAACKAAHYLAKEYDGSSDDVSNEQMKTLPKAGKVDG